MTSTLHDQTTELEVRRIQDLFKRQRDNAYAIGNTTVNERRKKLKALHDLILKYRTRIYDAMYQEFKKPRAEVDLTEIYVLTAEIKNTRKHLGGWMRDQSVDTPLSLLGARSYIRHESKGNSLIIAPWNFPLQLAIGPLISAIAAGCPVIIKPSEMTPLIAGLVKEMLAELFDESEVAVVEGGVDVSTALLSLPFAHIFFTGSPQVGKIVMRAASEHLSSVTLELGGKSPTIVDQSADIASAARRICLGKFFNCGQICIAPDYVLVHESVKDALVKKLKENIIAFYSKNAQNSSSYARMVNNRHWQRIVDYIEEAREQGATIHHGGDSDGSDSFISPTIIADLAKDTALLQEEIFGPVLPIVSFKDPKESVQFIQHKEKPLALYVFSKNRKRTAFYLNNTRAGGTCINNTDIHYYNHNLPFGGINNSGIGKAHGHYGFMAFTNQRAVLKQVLPGALEILKPPFTDFKQRIINATINWL